MCYEISRRNKEEIGQPENSLCHQDDMKWINFVAQLSKYVLNYNLQLISLASLLIQFVLVSHEGSGFWDNIVSFFLKKKKKPPHKHCLLVLLLLFKNSATLFKHSNTLFKSEKSL